MHDLTEIVVLTVLETYEKVIISTYPIPDIYSHGRPIQSFTDGINVFTIPQ